MAIWKIDPFTEGPTSAATISRLLRQLKDLSVSRSSALRWLASSVKLVVSPSSSTYDLGRWMVERDRGNSGRVGIAIREASDYSEPLRPVSQGFLNEYGSKHTKASRLYTSSRVASDLIPFRMNDDIVQLLQGL